MDVSSSPLLQVYRRTDIVMTHGEGCYLIDDKGKKYLDFAAGIAVNALGHSHPALVNALKSQGEKLWHCSNMFHTDVLDRYAAALVKASGFADKVFFGSSGSEAVEAMLKTIRRYHHMRNKTHPPERGNRNDEPVPRAPRTTILVAEGAFHGRTMGALSACFHKPSREGFEPLLQGFSVIAFNDISDLTNAIDDSTAAVLLEPIQGEGGVRSHTTEYLQNVRTLCDEYGLLLAFDEVQCGFGRTGDLFAFQSSGITPDIVTLAKGIGGGFPLSAMLLTDKAASGMTPGSHGSTYGSNPLAAAVGEAMLNELLKPDFLPHVTAIGNRLKSGLQTLVKDFPHLFAEVRGRGLMLGLALRTPPALPPAGEGRGEGVSSSTNPAAGHRPPTLPPQAGGGTSFKYDFAAALRNEGLIVSPAVTEVLRILPPLIIDIPHVDEALAIMRRVASLREFTHG